MQKFIKGALVALVVMVVVIALMSQCGKKKTAPVPPATTAAVSAQGAAVTKTAEPAIQVKTALPVRSKAAAAAAKPAAPAAKKAQAKSTGPVNVKDYEFKVSKDKTTFEVVKKGAVILSKAAGDQESFAVGAEGADKALPKIGTDLTGDGKPDMVLKTKSEKDSCSNIYSIFSIGDEMQLVAEVKGLADGIEFKDLDKDKIPEIIGHDCTFLDWWAMLGSTAAPRIVLSYLEGTGYVMAPDLMRKDPPSDAVMQKFAASCKGKPISKVWSYMLDLIYTGNGDTAMKFYEMVDFDAEAQATNDQGVKADKTEYLEAFKEHLSTSPYWPAIKKLNNWEYSDMGM